MAFTGNFVCTSFKVDLFYARHNFNPSGGNTFKIALYNNTAAFTAATTAYTSSNEMPSTGNYSAGGNTLVTETTFPKASGTTALQDFVDSTWTASTISNARGALIYNDTITTPTADASVVVLDFGADKSSAAGDFTVQFPANDASNCIIRIA